MITFAISYAFQQLVLWQKLQITPLSSELVRIVALFGLLMLANYLLPHFGHPLVDSVWRSLVIGIFGWWLLRRLETFRGLVAQIKELFVEYRTRKKGEISNE